MPPRLLGTALREPLVHFLLLGAAIYGLYFALTPSVEREDENVVRVSAGKIAWMQDSWQKRWNRPPTPAELDGLVEDHVRETILYREALAMGLDRDDVIVRRRLGQKLEFLSQDLLAPAPPDDATLQAWFQERRDQYRDPALVTFTHVFVDPDRREDRTLADADAILAALGGQEPTNELLDEFGDPFLLQRYYPQRTELEIGKLFGREFATSLLELTPGKWYGPVLSGYGVHLVWMHDHQPARELAFADVRDRVALDWEQERRRELNEGFYDGLRARYEVVVEEAAGPEALAEVEAR